MVTTAMVLATAEPPQEQRLWRAVLVTTIQEWISGPLRYQRQAEEFLFRDNKDFTLVCQSAGMDADRLRSQLSRLRKVAIDRCA